MKMLVLGRSNKAFSLNVSAANLRSAVADAPSKRPQVETQDIQLPKVESPKNVQTPQPGQEPNNKAKGGKLFPILLASFVVGVLGLVGFHFYQVMSSTESTDDAYLTGHMSQISSRVDGTVQDVLVEDNQHVSKGQVLFKLDPRDYQVKVQQAQAALDNALREAQVAKVTVNYSATNAGAVSTQAQGGVADAKAAIESAQSGVAQAVAGVPIAQSKLAQAKAELNRAQLDYQRYSQLLAQGAVSTQQRDNAKRDLDVDTAAYASARDEVNQAQAKVLEARGNLGKAQAQLTQSQGSVKQAQAAGVQTQVDESQVAAAQAKVAQAQAALNEAQLNLSYATVVAPASGRIGKKSIEVGQRVQPGQAVMEVVSDDSWIVANFKETQLERMHPGQAVEIKVDAFPHHTFKGYVDSFSPGSGASFALLPPDNATGNFTKIVQRVPVKIVFDAQSIKGFENTLVQGMSAVVDVKVQ